MKKIFFSLSALLFMLSSFCAELSIQNTMLYFERDGVFAQVSLKWKHAWNHDKSRDGVWIFFKSLHVTNGAAPITVRQNGHELLSVDEKGASLSIQSSPDSAGVFVALNKAYRGNIHAVIKVKLAGNSFNGLRMRESKFQSYGIEMVQVPKGAYFIGDTSQRAIQHNAFYKQGSSPDKRDFYSIDREQAVIEVGTSPGSLYYTRGRESYGGDQGGPIPASFPKGVNGFLMMKYEPTQQLYVDFLNSLTKDQRQYQDSFLAISRYASLRGTIRKTDHGYSCAVPEAPLNFITWSNALALADWCGLRPMTDLEYNKASRGPRKPASFDFPWGVASKFLVRRVLGDDGKHFYTGTIDEGQLTDQNLVQFGASYYWIMDLSGSVWERVVTLGHADGRNFKGSHGDGRLNEKGYATNEDWPAREGKGEGFGFLGGGFYNQGRDYHEYNPFSPISYRPYGSWAGHESNEAYGCRFIRTWD